MSVELGHDAAKGKYIDRRVIISRPKQQLRGPVPSGGDIVSKGRPGPNFSGKA